MTKHIVFLISGYNQSAINNKKFKLLADRLLERNIDSIYFDYLNLDLKNGKGYCVALDFVSVSFLRRNEEQVHR